MGLFPKFKLSPKLVKLAYRFIDVEASGETAIADARTIEYSFVISKLDLLPRGKVLDIGCVARVNYLPAALAWLGWQVWGIDLREFKFRHPNFHFVLQDVRNTDFPAGFFDAVLGVSTLEHIGLGGRYGVARGDPEGDVKVVKEVARILRPGGTFLVTIPCGQRKIVKSLHRIYDTSQLRELFADWKIKDEIYYVLSRDGFWETVPETVATSVNNLSGEQAVALLELIPLK